MTYMGVNCYTRGYNIQENGAANFIKYRYAWLQENKHFCPFFPAFTN